MRDIQASAELEVDRLVAGARSTLQGIKDAIVGQQLEQKVARQLATFEANFDDAAADI